MFPLEKDLKVLSKSLQWVFGEAATFADGESPVILRERKFDAALLAKTFVFGFWRHPDATNVQLAQTACELGCSVGPSAIEQRGTQAASEFFKGLLLKVVQRRIRSAGPTGWLSQFTSVDLLDSTTVTLPAELRSLWQGCSSIAGPTAALKVQTQMDFLHGDLRLELRPGVESDQRSELKTTEIKAGSMQIRDLGYFDLDAMQTIDTHRAFFVSRLQDSTALYDTKTGKRLDLAEELQAILCEQQKKARAHKCQPRPARGQRIGRQGIMDRRVLVGKEQRVPMRLVALRVPRDVAKARRAKLKIKGRKKGYRPKPETLELRGWSIYVTNHFQLPVEFIQALLRLRWQIELLFKLWKSQTALDKTRSRNPWRVLCEVYVKMLIGILQHWIMVTAHWHKLNRSWPKAAKIIRDWSTTIALSLASTSQLAAHLQALCKVIDRIARTETRRSQPAAHQLIENPEANGYKRVAT